MRSGHQEQLAAVAVGVLCDPLRVQWCAHLATLRRFDTKVPGTRQNDPLIPCERRLAKSEISENQEVTFELGFENRDYDRPFGHILVTLQGFD